MISEFPSLISSLSLSYSTVVAAYALIMPPSGLAPAQIIMPSTAAADILIIFVCFLIIQAPPVDISLFVMQRNYYISYIYIFEIYCRYIQVAALRYTNFLTAVTLKFQAVYALTFRDDDFLMSMYLVFELAMHLSFSKAVDCRLIIDICRKYRILLKLLLNLG